MYEIENKLYIDVSLPDVMLDYKISMSSVDLADMLIALHRTGIIAKNLRILR